jgi:hypothetical protein
MARILKPLHPNVYCYCVSKSLKFCFYIDFELSSFDTRDGVSTPHQPRRLHWHSEQVCATQKWKRLSSARRLFITDAMYPSCSFLNRCCVNDLCRVISVHWSPYLLLTFRIIDPYLAFFLTFEIVILEKFWYFMSYRPLCVDSYCVTNLTENRHGDESGVIHAVLWKPMSSLQQYVWSVILKAVIKV